MPEFDVVGIGSTVYDTLMVVDHFPQEDTKQRGIETRIQGGGPCATALVAAARLGLSAAYMGTIGGDSFGRYMLEDFARFGVDTSHVRVEPDAQKRAQTVKVSTVSGDLTVSAIAGDVIVSTVSGDQFVSCDANRVDANAVSGDVHIEGACEEWCADSVSGDMELLCTVAPTKKIDLNTMSGNVRVALPADIRGFVADISGMSGHITNEFGPNRYGTCALPIHMDTMSGSLLIARL